MNVSALKKAAQQAVDAAAATLFDISNKMHADVELSFEEVKAQAWQCAALKAAGFKVEEGLGSLKTAFRATISSGKPGPRVAFLCEYDGLPVYGQSCRHNVVA
ncbi:MAG: M20 family peptidase, partial [Enhydrobacter sp.]